MRASAIVKLFAALVAVASPAVAELAVTAPVGTTTCTGGQSCTVSWEDNHQGVTLAQQGNCTVALYTGNAQQQTFLQPIAFPTPVNVASTAAIQFVVDPTVGPNSSLYFIRISSTTLNQNGTTNPYLSFSAKFTLAGMTGTFNSTVQAQLAGISSTAGATSTGAATGATTTHAASTTTTHATTSASATHTGGAMSNAAGSTVVAAGALFAGLVALF